MHNQNFSRRKKEQDEEEIFEEIKVENFPKVLIDNKIKDQKNMENSKQDKYKNVQAYNTETSEY